MKIYTLMTGNHEDDASDVGVSVHKTYGEAEALQIDYLCNLGKEEGYFADIEEHELAL